MRLHDSWALALLALLPVAWWLWRRASRAPALRFPALASIAGLGSGRRAHWAWLPVALRLAAAALLILALARPQAGKAESRVFSEGIDIMLAVDVSGSMLAEDFTVDGKRVNRLEAVKSVVREFVANRPRDRVGLVLFSARPYTQAPLTLDHGWLLQNLERAEIGMIEDGTAIGSALASAVGRLEPSTAESKIVVLLTDGQNNAGRIAPEQAAQAAKTLGYRVYTIGAGTTGLAPFPATDLFGNKVYRPMEVAIDEDTLRQVAAETGGRYFRATDTDSLQGIYAEIDELEKSPAEEPRYTDYEEMALRLIVPALLLLLGELLLRHTVMRVLP
jgi:Ca-activated chloride channel family protein